MTKKPSFVNSVKLCMIYMAEQHVYKDQSNKPTWRKDDKRRATPYFGRWAGYNLILTLDNHDLLECWVDRPAYKNILDIDKKGFYTTVKLEDNYVVFVTTPTMGNKTHYLKNVMRFRYMGPYEHKQKYVRTVTYPPLYGSKLERVTFSYSRYGE